MSIREQFIKLKIDKECLDELVDVELLESVKFYQETNSILISLFNKEALSFNCYQELIEKYQDYTNSDVKITLKCDNVHLSNDDLMGYLNYFLQGRDLLNYVKIEETEEEYQLIVYSEEKFQLLEESLFFIKKSFENVGINNKPFSTILKNFESFKVDLPVKKKKNRVPDPNIYKEVKIGDIKKVQSDVFIKGFVYDYDEFTKPQRITQVISVCDGENAIKAVRFLKSNSVVEKIDFKDTNYFYVIGDIVENNRYDSSDEVFQMRFHKIIPIIDNFINYDEEEVRRFEFHTHSKMSEMDGISDASDLVNTAYKMGLSGLAITDHANVQAFPSVYNTYRNIKRNDPETNFKVVYGVEASVSSKINNLINFQNDGKISDQTYVILDLETTGLSVKYCEIIEFGAIKYQGGGVVDRLEFFIKPTQDIPAFISEKTNIYDRDVANARSFKEEAQRIKDFIGDSVIVAHNASFDFNFLNESFKRCGESKLTNNVIDTLALSRNLLVERRYFSLGRIAKYFNVDYDETSAHRASYDCDVLLLVLQGLFLMASELGIHTLKELNDYVSEDYIKRANRSHTTILVKNQKGIPDLYNLISLSNTKYLAFFGKTNTKKNTDEFSSEPRLPKEVLADMRKNLLIGSSCINNELIELAINSPQEDFEEAITFYDYIEIQQPQAYNPLLAKGLIKDKKQLEEILINIIDTAKKYNKLVIVTGDVHYSFAYQKQFREVLISAKGIGGVNHPLYLRDSSLREEFPSPNAHLQTTKEIKDQFSFLDEALVEEIVVTNTLKLADMIENVAPIKDGLFPPELEDNEKKLTELCFDTAYKQYGNPLPLIVKERLERELKSITTSGFSVVYYVSHLLVKKSLDDGRMVGSRGSVGSSFVATMAGITEVNPLIPHYYCPNCQFSEFFDDGSVKSGYDLPDKLCPKCQTPLKYDGQDIPFETFLGFKGDKIPDIDLNFMSDYQDKAHNYIKELFGEDHVFRAGTISTIQFNTAYGYVKGYYEDKKQSFPSQLYLNYLAYNCTGTKRTTGQHPGGIVVVPKHMHYEEFTPIQFPANDASSLWNTTHFDYNDIHDNLLKFDILGHQDPAAMYMYKTISDVDPVDIPLNDQKVLSIFSSTNALNIKSKNYKEKNGALGLPEFGTFFVRSILDGAKPTSVADLIAISGISHGTGNWRGNADVLIDKKVANLSQVIGCRDDIMLFLMSKGLNSKDAFDIMESIRKGKGIKPEWESLLTKHKVEKWYVESAKKIKYLFPKAHAVAYVMMCLRVAWYKVYQPHVFYAVYFSLRCVAFDIETMIAGESAILRKVTDLKYRINDSVLAKGVSKKENDIYDTLEVALEMVLRGYHFRNISITKSRATEFYVDPDDNHYIIPPFNTVDGLGDAAANSIVEARNERPFVSKKDLIERTAINTTVVKRLDDMNCLADLPDDDQLRLF